MNTSINNAFIAQILERDLNKVITELHKFQTEENIWLLEGKINNTAGNLALHIAGAIEHFIGAVLGNNGYIREREKEFSEKHVPRSEIISSISRAIETVKTVIPKLTDEDWQKDFPEKIGAQTFKTGFFLIHLISHINYHLGQINYHRRLLDLSN